MAQAEVSLFTATDYKQYLNGVLRTSGEARGTRSRLAAHLGCQTAFVSQVLKGNAHFSLEHAVLINEFLAHTEDESRYFMLLVEVARAGSAPLRAHFQKQLDEILRRREVVRERISVKESLSLEHQHIYYGSWYHSAIHVLLSIPALQTKAALAERLRLPASVVSESVDFLVSIGLAEPHGSRYRIGKARIHLGLESPLLTKHHLNWRLQAMQSVERRNSADLHYSSVISLSESDVAKFRGLLLEAIAKSEKLLQATGEETAYGLLVDFFNV